MEKQKNMNCFRGFIAVDIKPSSEIYSLGREIKQTKTDVKLVEPENIHITLKFLGETQEELIRDIEEIMKESVKGIQPFTVQLKNVGVFPNKNYIRVVWIGIENSEKLRKIAEYLDEHLTQLGFKKEKKSFSAHLTIARVKSSKNKEKLLRVIEKYNDFEFTTNRVDTVKLKKSELTPMGPVYTTVCEIKIGTT